MPGCYSDQPMKYFLEQSLQGTNSGVYRDVWSCAEQTIGQLCLSQGVIYKRSRQNNPSIKVLHPNMCLK